MPARLAARGKSQAALRADLFRQLGVAESAKYSSMPVVLRLDLTKNLALSHAADFHHGLLGSAFIAGSRLMCNPEYKRCLLCKKG